MPTASNSVTQPTDVTRAILKARGYTVPTLAADLKVSARVADRILNGKNSLQCSDITLLCNRLGVSPNFMMGLRPPQTAQTERLSRWTYISLNRQVAE